MQKSGGKRKICHIRDGKQQIVQHCKRWLFGCVDLCFFFFKQQLLFVCLFVCLFILFMAVLGLGFCARAFSSCGKWGPLFIAVRGPLTIVLRSTGSRRAGSVVVAHGPSRSAACGILPDHGSNPCPLHWQADSQPLCHQGSPVDLFLTLY